MKSNLASGLCVLLSFCFLLVIFRSTRETAPVDITDGKLDIKFVPNIQNPEINGIEIIPGS